MTVVNTQRTRHTGIVLTMKNFEQWLVRRGHKQSTINLRLSHMHSLLGRIKTLSRESVEDNFFTWYKSGTSGSTLNNYLDTLRIWDEFRGCTEFSDVPFFKEVESLRVPLSDEEIKRFLELPKRPEQDKKNHWMYNMFWRIAAYSGMRLGEVADLKIGDIDLGRGVYMLRDTKTRETRQVPIHPMVLNDLKNYICLVTEGLFVLRTGRVLYKNLWGVDFRKRLEVLGIKRTGLTPYSVRHTFATSLFTEVPIFTLQKMLGHRRIETTAKYIKVVTKDVTEAVRKLPYGLSSIEPKSILKILKEFVDTLDHPLIRKTIKIEPRKLVIELEYD